MSLFGSNERKEHVESDLDSVEEEQSVLVRDESEVDEVDKRPDLPGSLAGRKKIGLDLGSNGCEGVTVDKSKVGEEHRHEDRAPQSLVDDDLLRDRKTVLSGNFAVEPVVEVVTGRSVVKKTEGRKSDESLDVESCGANENLFFKKNSVKVNKYDGK